MQSLYLLLCWLFFGLLTSKIARKQGKNGFNWFIVGVVLGVIGVALAYFLPKLENKIREKQKKGTSIVLPAEIISSPPPGLPEWFFLNSERKALGPYNLKELSDYFQTNQLSEESYIWSEGMEQWKKIKELPEVLKQLLSK